MGTFPLDTNIVSSGNIPSILMTGYLLGTFPLDTAGMAVYTWPQVVRAPSGLWVVRAPSGPWGIGPLWGIGLLGPLGMSEH